MTSLVQACVVFCSHSFVHLHFERKITLEVEEVPLFVGRRKWRCHSRAPGVLEQNMF